MGTIKMNCYPTVVFIVITSSCNMLFFVNNNYIFIQFMGNSIGHNCPRESTSNN